MRLDLKYSLVVFLVLCLPFSGNNSPIKYPYQFIFLFVGCIGVLYLLKFSLVATNKYKNISMLLLLVIVINVIAGLSNFLLYNVESITDFVGFLIALPLTIVVALVIKNEKRKLTIYRILLWLVILNFIFGVIQLVLGQDIIFGNPAISGRISGIFSWGAPVVGSFAGVVFPVVVYFFIHDKRKLTAAIIFFSIVIMLGGNRSMLIVDFITLIALLLLTRKHRLYAIKLTVISTTILLVSLPIIFIYLQDLVSSNLMYRLSSLGGGLIEEQKTKRIATWVQTLCLFADYPLFGVGFGNFKESMVEYLYCMPMSEGQMPHPHHVYLDILSSSGSLGFIAFFCLVLYILLMTKVKVRDPEVRLENYLILLIIFSPLNVTHGFISTWWSVICFIMIGIAVSNLYITKSYAAK